MNENFINIKGVRIGLTGATGVLGSKLIHLLLKEGANIVCFVRKTSNTKDIEQQVSLCYGELTDIDSVEAFITQIDICIHLAAQVSPTSTKNYYLSNATGTENICKAIINRNPSCRLVNCSSIAAYRIKGFCKLQFTDYAKSKLAADNLVDHYIRTKSLKATTIIPGLIYGPGKNLFIPTVIEGLKNNQLFFVQGGEKYAPLSYIDDLCDLFMRAIKNKNAIGNKYFGINYTEKGIHDFIKLIAQKTSYTVPDKIHDKKRMMYKAIFFQLLYSILRLKKHPKLSIRMVDVLSINYHLSKAQRTNNLGWTPRVDMEEGVNLVLSQYNFDKKEKENVW